MFKEVSASSSISPVIMIRLQTALKPLSESNQMTFCSGTDWELLLVSQKLMIADRISWQIFASAK